MSATIAWKIVQMVAYPQLEGQTDVVFEVYWSCNGAQTANGKTYSDYVTNTAKVTYTAGSPYTPYADLTQAQVLGWVWASGVDQAVTEAAVQQAIDLQINPPVVSPPLPWVQPVTDVAPAA